MTFTRLKFAQRLLLGIMILTVAAVLLLRLLGAISTRTVLVVFITIELPSIIVLITTTLLQIHHIKKHRGLHASALWDAVEKEMPPLRPIIMETRLLSGLISLVRGKKYGVDSATKGFDYAKGTLAVPVAMGIVTIIEAGILHVLISSFWLRVLLLFLSFYGLLLFTGVMAARIINPHLLSPEGLRLKWGRKTVLETPLRNIASIDRISNHQFTQPAIEGSLLVLTSLTSTNVRLLLHEAVSATPPLSRRHIPENFAASEIALYVADPDEFVHCVLSAQALLK